jgi:hypothetical protein
VQLSSYSDQARVQYAALRLHRSLGDVLQGARVGTEKAEVHGKPLWRLVAGPVAARERGKWLCETVRYAGLFRRGNLPTPSIRIHVHFFPFSQ